MLKNIWIPGAYHGRSIKKIYFEGWYDKFISPDQRHRWAVIPGIFLHPDPKRRHAFIQILDGITSQVIYHRFPVESFSASRSAFIIQIENNYFHSKGCTLDITGQGQQISGKLHFDNLQPWPVRVLSPGVMGPYRFAPFMQTYHGILSLDHSIKGELKFNDIAVDFTGGRGYLEKDWGQTFPRAYIWMQSNHFPEAGTSLTASVATIPWMGSWFRGFLIGLLVAGKLYRFTTYLGSKIDSLVVTDQFVTWKITGTGKSDPSGEFHCLELSINAERGEGGLLSSPELDGMTPRILESLTASVEVNLLALDRDGQPEKILYQGRGSCAGLEVAGTINEIIDINKDLEI